MRQSQYISIALEEKKASINSSNQCEYRVNSRGNLLKLKIEIKKKKNSFYFVCYL